MAGACTFSLGLAVANSRGFQLEVGEMLVGFYGPVTRVWEFAAGALLALVPNWAVARTRSSGVVHGLAGVLLLGAAVVLISGDVPFPGPWTILPVLGTVLLIRAGGRPDNTPATLLRTAPMVRLGDWSYSIYLWHWPFIVFAGALFPTQAAAPAVAAALSLIPAIASYRWVEGPLRAMELRGARRIGGVALVCLTLPVGLAVLLSAAVDRGFWSNTIQAHQRAVLQPHAGCYGYEPLSPGRAEECTLNASADGAPLYLVGDSHAQHFSEAVLGAGVELERPVVISTATNCPIVDMHLRFASAPPGHNEQCAGFSRGTIAYLATAQAGTVVLATSDRYWTDDEFELGTTASTMTSAADDKLQAARLAIAATVRAMQQAGHDVLLVDDVPRWEGRDEWTPHNCSVATLLTGVGACDRAMPVARAEERQGEVRAVLRDVASSTGSGLLDPWAVLCPDGRCSTQRDGYTAYRDTNHISVPQSRALAPTFRVAIDR